MYRPPGSSSIYNAEVRRAIQSVSEKNQTQVLICGDFNFKEIDWEANDVSGGPGSEQARFFDTCHNCYLHQHVRDFTRVRGNDQPSVLDLILSKNELEVDSVEYGPPIGSSDHCVLSFQFYVESEGLTVDGKFKNHKRNYHKGSYTEASALFDAIDWEGELANQGVEEAWSTFLGHYRRVVEKTVPLYPIRTQKQHKKWVNKQVLNIVWQKKEAWIRHRKHRKSKRLKEVYLHIQNKCMQIVRKAKQDYEHKLAQEIRYDPRAFYAYARSKTTIKEEVLAMQEEDGEMTKTMEETCEVMNKQFQEVFNRTDGMKPPPVRAFAGRMLEKCSTGAEEVRAVLQQLKTPSAPGSDGVHPILLKQCALNLAKPLAIICTRSVESGELGTQSLEAGQRNPHIQEGEVQ